MSQTLVQRPTPVHDFSSREVIDVDDLVPSSVHNYADDDDIQFIAHRPGRLTHEPIVIGDSDDDVEIVAGPSHPAPAPNARAQRNQQIRRPNRRVLFSPSPPPQDNYVPPVPPLPPRFGFARDTPPLRYRPPPDIDLRGVVRPMEQPFRFEQGLPAQPRLPPVQDAHHNHEQERFGIRHDGHDAAHRPNIALGGGMLALNRRNQFEPAHPAPPRVENNSGWRGFFGGFGLAAYRMFFQAPDGSPGPERRDVDEDRDLLEALVLDAEERQPDLQFRLIHNPFGRRHRHQQPRQEESSYKPTFTHPTKPEPGFSNDFVTQEVITISDGPGPSSAHETGTALVCAVCLDHLVMNVVGPEEEIRKFKLFALRCGHILDGKCIDAIMKPPPIPDQEDSEMNDRGDETLSIKGKSKAKVEGTEPLQQASCESGFAARSKGKRRAIEPEDDDASAPSIPSKRKPEDSFTPECYIRSRLRPRHKESGRSSAIASTSVEPVPASVPAGQFENGTAPALDSSIPSRRSTRHGNRSIPDHDPVLHAIPSVRSVDYAVQPAARRRPGRPRAHGAKGRARRKGKGKAPALVIEAEYEWSCPVPSCGHKHKSVRIAGVWRMDERQGAIAMYV